MIADKILIAGPRRSGRSTFARILSDAEPGPDSDTRPDYGRVVVHDRPLHLMGPPGQIPLPRLMPVIAPELLGAVILVNSADATTFPTARELAAIIAPHVPALVIAANFQDDPAAQSPDTIATALALGPAVPVRGTVATDPAAVSAVLVAVLEQHPQQEIVAPLVAGLKEM